MLSRSIVLSLGLVSSSLAFGVSLKNFRELNGFYSRATNVSEQTVNAVYVQVRSRLPLHGDASELSSPSVLAATELAGAYCDAMITADKTITDRARRWAHRAIDFNVTSADQPEASVQETVRIYSELFFERELTASEQDMVMTSFRTLRASTPNVGDLLLVLCSQMASSVDALTYR